MQAMTRQEAINKWNLEDYAISYVNLDGKDITPLVKSGTTDKHGTLVKQTTIWGFGNRALIMLNTTASTEADY